MITATKRQVENIHAVFDRFINSIQDVFAAGIQQTTGNVYTANDAPGAMPDMSSISTPFATAVLPVTPAAIPAVCVP